MNTNNRQYLLVFIFSIIGVILLIRLFYIQVVSDDWKRKAASISERQITIYPSRGLIFDRNHSILVANRAVYDLMIVPNDVKIIDTLAFCELVGVSKKVFLGRLKKATKYSLRKPSIFEKQIPAEEFGRIAEQLHKYPGFFGQSRTLRQYPLGIAPHTLGYISEVSPRIIAKNSYYKPGDYIGASGLEHIYENDLKGKRGIKYVVVDVHNNVKGTYAHGLLDSIAESGTNLVSTLDAKLQAYGEQLMANKRGTVVAIEPSTGEILALISAPSYDPNLLVGRSRSSNYNELVENDSLNPLFNRALNAQYRPGSIFKLIESLVGLQTGVITPNTRFPCNRNIIGCHGNHSYDDLKSAIFHSCNPYFYNVYKKLIQQGKNSNIFIDSRIGLTEWRHHVMSFGLGQKLATEFENQKAGYVPDTLFYDKWYGARRWAFSTIYSNSIGEGELGVVPIQMANVAAIIANKGYYYKPHLIKSIGENGTKRDEYLEKNYTTIAPEHFQLVQDAMQLVVESPSGTAGRARIKGIEVCGKTGTVQNGDFKDHSVFIAFAPKENPKIAIAVYVEYAGFGGTWAAPIASLMMEKYLTDTIIDKRKEQRILDAVIYDRQK